MIGQHAPVNYSGAANPPSLIGPLFFLLKFISSCALYAKQVTSVYISCSGSVLECVFFNYVEAEAEPCSLFCHLMFSFHQPQEAEPVFRVVNEA